MADRAVDPSRLSEEEQAELLRLLEEENDYRDRRRFFDTFPDETTTVGGTTYWARDLYPKHMAFLAEGARRRERCFMAANRVGKTVTGAFETTAHLTGLYPDWWEGRRFDRPIAAAAAGKTNETTRDVVQAALFGPLTHVGARRIPSGTGMIPARALKAQTWKSGVPDLIDTARIEHVSGECSTLCLKSYHQGRGVFEGVSFDVVWFDEEPPLDVYNEALIRTATTDGVTMLTFTPLDGVSETVLSFMPGGDPDKRHVET